MLSLEMSAPTWKPLSISLNFVLQVVDPVPAPPAKPRATPLAVTVELVFRSRLPPTPRTHTPPPSWPGCGLAGDPTNAVLWDRKAVFEATMVDDKAAVADTAPPNTAL
jgi:hypothetical protein